MSSSTCIQSTSISKTEADVLGLRGLLGRSRLTSDGVLGPMESVAILRDKIHQERKGLIFGNPAFRIPLPC